MINAIQGYDFAVPKITPKPFQKLVSKEQLSAEHLLIIQRLLSLGIIPSYDYEKDLNKLYEALAAMAATEVKNSNESDKEDKLSDIALTEKAADAANQVSPFADMLDQSALLNRILLNLY